MESEHQTSRHLLTPSVKQHPAATAQAAVRQRSLLTVAGSLLATVGTASFVATVLAHGCTLLRAQRGSLFAVNQAGETVIAVSSSADDPSTPVSSLDEPRLAAHLLHRTLPLIVDCADDPQARQAFCHGGDCPLVIGAPLQWDGRQIGVVQLVRTVGERSLGGEELGVLIQFGELAAAALARHLALTADAPVGGAAVLLTHALHEAMSHSADLSASLSASLAAAEQERRRLGSELHDGVRPSLLGAQLQLEAVRADLRAGALDAGVHGIARVQQTLAAADSEMSRIVRALRPAVLAEAGLVAALLDLGMRWSTSTGITLTFELEQDLLVLPEATAMALYRIAQESLSNIARHSSANLALLGLRQSDAVLSLVIRDNGQGNAAPRGGGVGMFSISERAHSIGAILQVESPPGAGTRVVVTMPLPAWSG